MNDLTYSFPTDSSQNLINMKYSILYDKQKSNIRSITFKKSVQFHHNKVSTNIWSTDSISDTRPSVSSMSSKYTTISEGKKDYDPDCTTPDKSMAYNVQPHGGVQTSPLTLTIA